MRLIIEKRDLFTVPKEYFLCHCISADFAMGAGIAKKFTELGVKQRLQDVYNGRYNYSWFGTGDCLWTKATDWAGEYNLVTKGKYWEKPTEVTMQQALTKMRVICDAGDKIAMPKIGCGLDKMKWSDVEAIMREVFADTDVEIFVCDWS